MSKLVFSMSTAKLYEHIKPMADRSVIEFRLISLDGVPQDKSLKFLNVIKRITNGRDIILEPAQGTIELIAERQSCRVGVYYNKKEIGFFSFPYIINTGESLTLDFRSYDSQKQLFNPLFIIEWSR